ncbi:hypothetical protein [Streptomyces wuyuanensis]|uniref:hypothetical protein n=1 Tax=Streptomyces wuyuanensis TaxID=1196353 RepID=UPI0037186B0B
MVVLDITAADEDTLRIVMDSLQRQWPPPASLRPGAPRASPASPPGSTPTSGDPAGSRDHCVHARLRGEAGAVANWRQAPRRSVDGSHTTTGLSGAPMTGPATYLSSVCSSQWKRAAMSGCATCRTGRGGSDVMLWRRPCHW